MLIWLQHKDHGFHPVYNDFQLERCLANGWERRPEKAEVIPLKEIKEKKQNKTSPAQLAATKRYQAKKRALKNESITATAKINPDDTGTDK
jgi:hypothetical protein